METPTFQFSLADIEVKACQKFAIGTGIDDNRLVDHYRLWSHDFMSMSPQNDIDPMDLGSHLLVYISTVVGKYHYNVSAVFFSTFIDHFLHVLRMDAE